MSDRESIECSTYPVALIREPLDGPAPAFVRDDSSARQEWLPGITHELGVRIVDRAHGAAYVVTVLDLGHEPAELVSRWDAPILGGREGIAWLSDSALAALAVAYLRRRALWLSELPADDARMAEAGMWDLTVAEDVARNHKRPALGIIASEARLAMQSGVPLETWFGDSPYQVSAATTRRWIRAAREAGLLPELPGKPGRPRKTRDEGTER
jgi:hypothetical protein